MSSVILIVPRFYEYRKYSEMTQIFILIAADLRPKPLPAGRVHTSQSTSLQQIASHSVTSCQTTVASPKPETPLKTTTSLLPPPLPPRSNSRHQFGSSTSSRVTSSTDVTSHEVAGSSESDSAARPGGPSTTGSKKDSTGWVLFATFTAWPPGELLANCEFCEFSLILQIRLSCFLTQRVLVKIIWARCVTKYSQYVLEA